MRAMGFTAVVTIFLLFFFPLSDVVAGEAGRNGLDTGTHLLWIAIIILAAKLSNLIERFGQPAVLGELLVGVILGNMALAGFNFFEPIRQDVVIRFLAEIGVVILLFQVGLESNTQKMRKVGTQAFLVAIVAAFAAGLVLEPVHFRHFDAPNVVSDINESIKQASPEVRKNISNVLESLAHNHIKELIQPLGYFLVPIFFVLTGMEVRIETLFNARILLLALAISVAALGGKIISGLAAGRVRKSIVGWGMVPRGEVGLIFAATGKALGVFPDDIFSMMVIVIMFTTILPPPILNALLKRQDPALCAEELKT